ncbi:MAG: hypothetical protein H6739_11565 [Alphaproteobacteria bacterium]|nr:hypothetical protein [Alphaproteobacteria bacterium]
MRPTPRPLALAVLLAGCGEAPPEVVPDDELDVFEATPYTPGYTAADVGERLTAALAPGLPEPFTPLTTYQQVFDAFASPGCPEGALYEVPGDYIGCTAEGGAFYFGPILYAPSTNPDTPTEFSVIGDGYIIDPDGRWLYAGGELAYQPTSRGDARQWFYMVSGTWGYSPAGNWLGERWSGVIHGDGEIWAEDGWVIQLHGSMSRDDEDLFIDHLLMDAAACGVHASGTLKLRDPGGGWYALTVDDCQGCGEVVFEETEALGSACVDFAEPALALAAHMWVEG